MAAAFATTPFERTTANASSYSKARAANVGAGSVLVALTYQASATNTCTSVSDDLGNTWVKAFGPTRGSASVSNESIYGWYALNSAAGGSPTAGTITATWSGAADGGLIIAEITGLAGGGALDSYVSSAQSGTYAGTNDFTFGSTSTLGQSVCAAVALTIQSTSAGLTSPYSPLVADSTIDYFNFERMFRAITSSNAAINYGHNASYTLAAAGGMMVFKDAAVNGFTAGATLGAVVASGSLQSVMSGFTAGATLAAVLAGGNLGANPGTFTLGPILVNGIAQAGAALDYVRIYSDAGILLYERLGGSLDGTGSTVLSTSAAPPGTAVRIDWQLSTGKRRMPRVTMG